MEQFMHATAQSDHSPSMLINCAGALTSKPRPNTCLQQPRHPTPSHNLTNNTATQKQLCAQTQSHLNSSPRKVTTARIQNQQVRMHTSLHNSASAFCATHAAHKKACAEDNPTNPQVQHKHRRPPSQHTSQSGTCRVGTQISRQFKKHVVIMTHA